MLQGFCRMRTRGWGGATPTLPKTADVSKGPRGGGGGGICDGAMVNLRETHTFEKHSDWSLAYVTPRFLFKS